MKTLRQKFDEWYASPRGEAQFQTGMHYLGWAYVCYAEGYKQAAKDLRQSIDGPTFDQQTQGVNDA